jgi:hypothetical protein
MTKLKVIEECIVDGKQRYYIICDREIAEWLYDRDPVTYRLVYVTGSGYIFDIPEYTYICMRIIWSD